MATKAFVAPRPTPPPSVATPPPDVVRLPFIARPLAVECIAPRREALPPPPAGWASRLTSSSPWCVCRLARRPTGRRCRRPSGHRPCRSDSFVNAPRSPVQRWPLQQLPQRSEEVGGPRWQKLLPSYRLARRLKERYFPSFPLFLLTMSSHMMKQWHPDRWHLLLSLMIPWIPCCSKLIFWMLRFEGLSPCPPSPVGRPPSLGRLPSPG